MRILQLPTATSTSRVAADLGDEAEHGLVVNTDCQTAGRGQRGNTWEAEPGRNLTFSLVLRPGHWPAVRQFELSMVAAVAVAEAVEKLLGPDHRVTVKWPNDIYVGDRKICGILFENTLSGQNLQRVINGIGENINQRRVLSDAPNPVSVFQLTGTEHPLPQALNLVASAVIDAVDAYVANPEPENMSAGYHARLYRNDGALHPWRDAATGHEFQASILHVAPTGHLSLSVPGEAAPRTYAFKEVTWL